MNLGKTLNVINLNWFQQMKKSEVMNADLLANDFTF